MENCLQPIHDLINRTGINVSPVDGITTYAPTCEPYLTLTSGGFKEEGARVVTFKTQEEAVQEYVDRLAAYAENEHSPKSTLYWRRRPELYGCNGGFSITSRLLISAKDINPDFVTGSLSPQEIKSQNICNPGQGTSITFTTEDVSCGNHEMKYLKVIQGDQMVCLSKADIGFMSDMIEVWGVK